MNLKLSARRNNLLGPIQYISSNEINISSFGYGLHLIVVMVVDGISSNLLNITEQYKFSYLDPKIYKIVSSLLGGTLQVIENNKSKLKV